LDRYLGKIALPLVPVIPVVDTTTVISSTTP